MSQQVLPFVERIQAYLKYNRKKTIFLVSVAAVMQYYGFYSTVSQYYKSMEPFRMKLRRWILKEQNIKPKSLLETQIKLNSNSIDEIILDQFGEDFLRIDQQLFFGIGYYSFIKIFEKMGILDQENLEEEQKKIYKLSGYNRKINQQTCGMQYTTFLKHLEHFYSEFQKQGKLQNQNFFQFIQQVFQQLNSIEEELQVFENKVLQTRQEIIMLNAVYKKDKMKKMLDVLKENPLIKLDELEQELQIENFQTSIYEKIFVLKTQQALLTQMIQNKLRKNNLIYQDKYQIQLEELQLQKNDIKNQLNKLEKRYETLYKKSVEYYY